MTNDDVVYSESIPLKSFTLNLELLKHLCVLIDEQSIEFEQKIKEEENYLKYFESLECFLMNNQE